MKILVRNLDRKTTKDELEVLFREHGKVQSCNIVVDKETGESKGFAFVEMPKAGEAKAAIQNLNYKKVGSESIRVKRAQTNTEA